MLNSYSFFDVETPSLYHDSICQIAVIHAPPISSGRVTRSSFPEWLTSPGDPQRKPSAVHESHQSPPDGWTELDFLVDPEDTFHPRNISIHGIRPAQVAGKPKFPEVWDQIHPLFQEQIIVGHNVRFDLSVLTKNLYHYHLTPPSFYFIDTVELLRNLMPECRQGLKECCRYFSINLDQHHDALSDTRATLELFRILTQDLSGLNRFIHRYEPGDQMIGYDRGMCRNPATGKWPAARLSQMTRKILEMKQLVADIGSDRVITARELSHLNRWIQTNEDLSGSYPFDALHLTVDSILQDGRMDPEEEAILLELIDSFLNPLAGSQPCLDQANDLNGRSVCLTGEFSRGSRTEIEQLLLHLGASISKGVTRKTDVLLVGALGDERWSFGNYGTKVKKALELKEKGQPIEILSEKDACLDQIGK